MSFFIPRYLGIDYVIQRAYHVKAIILLYIAKILFVNGKDAFFVADGTYIFT